MKAIIKEIHCSDVDAWKDYLPSDAKDFVLPFELKIGIEGGSEVDQFSILVCGSKWFEREIADKKREFPVHHMVMEEYDASLLERAFSEKVNTFEGENWQELATQLSQVFYWEFDSLR